MNPLLHPYAHSIEVEQSIQIGFYNLSENFAINPKYDIQVLAFLLTGACWQTTNNRLLSLINWSTVVQIKSIPTIGLGQFYSSLKAGDIDRADVVLVAGGAANTGKLDTNFIWRKNHSMNVTVTSRLTSAAAAVQLVFSRLYIWALPLNNEMTGLPFISRESLKQINK